MVTAGTVGTWLLGNRGLADAGPSCAERVCLHDPNFMAKVRDAVGLYVRPPELGVVLCVDEKSQSGRWTAATMLPTRPGQPVRRKDD